MRWHYEGRMGSGVGEFIRTVYTASEEEEGGGGGGRVCVCVRHCVCVRVCVCVSAILLLHDAAKALYTCIHTHHNTGLWPKIDVIHQATKSPHIKKRRVYTFNHHITGLKPIVAIVSRTIILTHTVWASVL